MKNLIAYSTIALGTVLFTFGPAHAYFVQDDTNVNHSGGMNGNAKGDAEARGTANFTMSFSGSATTKGNFIADGDADMQNMFSGEDRPVYYYRPEGYSK